MSYRDLEDRTRQEQAFALRPQERGSRLSGSEVRAQLNPKAVRAARDGKIPLDLLEPVADDQIALVLQDGAAKYGRRNFTSSPIHARTYVGAVRRHVAAFLDGEDFDPDTGLSHWAHVGASVHVVLAAIAAGSFIDDRDN